jgi:hypothetical protein
MMEWRRGLYTNDGVMAGWEQRGAADDGPRNRQQSDRGNTVWMTDFRESCRERIYDQQARLGLQ